MAQGAACQQRFGSPRLSLPAVIGHEIVGVVETVPASFTHFAGQRVVAQPRAEACSCHSSAAQATRS